MFKENWKMVLLSMVGAGALMLLPDYGTETDNEVEADSIDDDIEKVSYTDAVTTRDASDNYTMLGRTDVGKDDEPITNEEKDMLEVNEEVEEEVGKDTDTNKTSESAEDIGEADSNTIEETVNQNSESSVQNNGNTKPNNVQKKETLAGNASDNKKEPKEEPQVKPNDTTPADVEVDVTNDSRPTSTQLLNNGIPVGTFMYGEKFSYYGDRSNLQFRRASGETLDVYVGEEYHLDENYMDAAGRNRQILISSHNGMTIVNNKDNGGYVVYMLYPR